MSLDIRIAGRCAIAAVERCRHRHACLHMGMCPELMPQSCDHSGTGSVVRSEVARSVTSTLVRRPHCYTPIPSPQLKLSLSADTQGPLRLHASRLPPGAPSTSLRSASKSPLMGATAVSTPRRTRAPASNCLLCHFTLCSLQAPTSKLERRSPSSW